MMEIDDREIGKVSVFVNGVNLIVLPMIDQSL